MDNPIEDLRSSKAFNYTQAVETIISIDHIQRDDTKEYPFTMYRSWRDENGEVHRVEVGTGVCSGIVDLGKDAPPPEPRKIENWAVLSFPLEI